MSHYSPRRTTGCRRNVDGRRSKDARSIYALVRRDLFVGMGQIPEVNNIHSSHKYPNLQSAPDDFTRKLSTQHNLYLPAVNPEYSFFNSWGCYPAECTPTGQICVMTLSDPGTVMMLCALDSGREPAAGHAVERSDWAVHLRELSGRVAPARTLVLRAVTAIRIIVSPGRVLVHQLAARAASCPARWVHTMRLPRRNSGLAVREHRTLVIRTVILPARRVDFSQDHELSNADCHQWTGRSAVDFDCIGHRG